MGRSPQPPPPRRGRSTDRTTDDRSDSRGASSERTNSSDIYYEPDLTRGSARGRSDVPPPPLFYEDAFRAGFQVGAAIQAQQAQFLDNEYNTGEFLPPRETTQPQGEPEPETPGGGTDPSDSDGSDDQGDGSDHPEHTDTDPYEDPTSSQAEVEPAPDLECIDVEDSPDESQHTQKEEETPAQTPREVDAPQPATEAASSASLEPIVVEQAKPKPSVPPTPMGRKDVFTGSIGQWSDPSLNPVNLMQKQAPAEPKEVQAPEKQSLAKAGEETAPQVASSEAAPSQETRDESSNPQQGEGESSSTSQAAPAETTASSAQEAPKSSPSEQQGPKEKTVELPASVPKSLLETMNRRRKPISKPPPEKKGRRRS